MALKFILAFILSTFLFSNSVFATGTSCEQMFNEDLAAARAALVNSAPRSSLAFKTEVDINQFRGTTFLTVMKEQIKPALDQYAEHGYIIASPDTILAALDQVSAKVRMGALKAAGGIENLRIVVTALQGQLVNLYDLPAKISATKIAVVNRYNLSTFLALASGGGVEVRLNQEDCCFNVNYGTGKTKKDEMTGRSFGEAPNHLADDASDKSYLKALQAYVESAGLKNNDFFKSLLQILTDSDTSGLKNVSPDGQAVMSDFTAIYVAEQDRHLMSGLKTHAWDVALLEVTLLSAFHSGQKKFMVMFDGILSAKVPKQAPGGEARNIIKDADMTDYWQFSSNPDPASKNRSGINVSKKDFRALGTLISDFMRTEHADLVQNVERHFVGIKTGGNIFAELSSFLINDKTPRSLENAEQLSTDFAIFLAKVQERAEKITQDRLRVQAIGAK